MSYTKQTKQRRLEERGEAFKKVMFWVGLTTSVFAIYCAGFFILRAIILLAEII